MTAIHNEPLPLVEDDFEVVDGVPVYDVVPYTGEAIQIPDMTNEQLAAVLDHARAFERAELADFKRGIQDEILARMDAAAANGETGAWTIRDGEWKLSGDSPDRTDYPVDELREVLKSLVEADLIGEDAITSVIVPERWKVSKTALKQLIKLGGPVRDAIESVERPVTRPRSVSVSREVR